MALQPFADLQEFLSLLVAALPLSLEVLVVEVFFVFAFLPALLEESFGVSVFAGLESCAERGAAVAPSRPVMAAATSSDFTEFFMFFLCREELARWMEIVSSQPQANASGVQRFEFLEFASPHQSRYARQDTRPMRNRLVTLPSIRRG